MKSYILLLVIVSLNITVFTNHSFGQTIFPDCQSYCKHLYAETLEYLNDIDNITLSRQIDDDIIHAGYGFNIMSEISICEVNYRDKDPDFLNLINQIHEKQKQEREQKEVRASQELAKRINTENATTNDDRVETPKPEKRKVSHPENPYNLYKLDRKTSDRENTKAEVNHPQSEYDLDKVDHSTSDLENIKPIVFPTNSSESAFLESETKKFNGGSETPDTKKEDNSEHKEQITFIHSSAKTMLQAYQPEPPVTQILGENVKEEKWEERNLLGYTRKEWARHLAGLSISDKNIEDPVIRDYIKKNRETIESFDGRVDNVMTTMGGVIDGTESPDKLDKELDILQSGLQADITDAHIYTSVAEVQKSIQNEAVNAMEKDVPEMKPFREVINAAETILGLPKEEKEDGVEN